MARVVRRSVDNSIEENILTAGIISTWFLEQTYHLSNPQYFTNSFAKTVMKWTLDYFDKFGEAPRHHIQNIFTIEKQHLDDAEMEIIETYLAQLSEKYQEDQGINDAYILDQALEYYNKREMEIRILNAQALMSIGKVDKAKEEILQMKKVMRLTSNWCNPFDTASISEVFDDRNQGIFRFPGALGNLIGDVERGWFLAWLAPFKRGKTWTLQELVVIAALSGLKAVFVSLEMQSKSINERIYKRLTAYGEEGKVHLIPIFDCWNNQLGLCNRVERKGSGSIGTCKDDVPEYDPSIGHVPCSACRGKSDSQFDLTSWFEESDKPTFTESNVRMRLKAFAKMYGNNIRVICYPRFSASVSDIKRDLNLLEQTEGFVPDVMAVDYADILKPEGNKTGREAIDDIWKDLAALFAERRMIGGSASQGNRGGIYKPNLDQTDIAEHIGKLAHVDVFTAINQTIAEKRKGIIRQALLAHRHKEFDESDNVTILQALSLGQTHLDSHR